MLTSTEIIKIYIFLIGVFFGIVGTLLTHIFKLVFKVLKKIEERKKR